MNKCELCTAAAITYCDSDQAYLCRSCDHKVHSANFLVARHSRTILCHVCHSPTQWSATGTYLGPTVSACSHCFTNDFADESVGRSDEDAKAVPPAASSSSSSDCESSSSSSPFFRDRRKTAGRKVTDLRLNATNPSLYSSGGIAPAAASSGGGRGARVKNLKRRRLVRSRRVGFMGPISTRALLDVGKLTRCQDGRSSAVAADLLKIRVKNMLLSNVTT